MSVSNDNQYTQSVQSKQRFLHKQIIQEQYDPEEFQQFMMGKQKELNLEEYSMQQLMDVVRQFKGGVLTYQQHRKQSNKQQQSKQVAQTDDQCDTNQASSIQIQEKRAETTGVKTKAEIPQQIRNNKFPQQQVGPNKSQKNPLQRASKPNSEQLNELFPRNENKPKIDLKQLIIPQYRAPVDKQGQKNAQQQTSKNYNKQLKKQQKQKQIKATNGVSPISLPANTTTQSGKKSQGKQQQQGLNKGNKAKANEKDKSKGSYFERQVGSEKEQNKQMIKALVGGESDLNLQKSIKNSLVDYQYQQTIQKDNSSLRQLTYSSSSANKLPFVIRKKHDISQLYQQKIRNPKLFSSTFKIRIPESSKQQSSSLFKFSYISYTIETSFVSNIHKSQTQWTVQRRYNDFKWLYECLDKSYKGLLPIPPIPEKTAMRSFDNQHIQERRALCEKFLQRCCALKDILSDAVMEAFLRVSTRGDFQALKKKLQNKLGRKEEENVIEFLQGQNVIHSKKQIYPQTKQFYQSQSKILAQLNTQLKQLQKLLSSCSQKSLEVCQRFTQLSQLYRKSKTTHENCIKNTSIFDLMEEFSQGLAQKLEEQSLHVNRYLSQIWSYEQKYTEMLVNKFDSLQKQKFILQTKYASSPQQQKCLPMFLKTSQLYNLALSLTLSEVQRHQSSDLKAISDEFLQGTNRYVNKTKEEMMNKVDLMTKIMVMIQGKQLKQVNFI